MDDERPDIPRPPSPALRSRVDIGGEVELAHREAAAARPEDGPYGELMANYAEWGDLLEAWNCGELDMTNEEFESACREHLDRAERLGQAYDRETAAQAAVLLARVAARHRIKGERG